MMRAPSAPPVPFVSVVLAVRNEAAFITRCVDAILAQDWPIDSMEILVADGQSTDGTPDIIRAMARSERVQILSNPARRQAAGLNLAIARARGDIIVRVDGHTQIAPDYLRCCVAALEQTGAACVGGRIEPVGLTPTGAVIAAVSRTAFAVPTAFHVSHTARFTDTVYLGAWSATVLARSSGFDEHLPANEDYELSYRIRRHLAGRVYLSPAIRSTYCGRQTLAALAHQYFWYGIGKAHVLLKHPASLRVRQLVAPLFVAGALGGMVCWLLVPLPLTRTLWLSMLLAYVALALGYSAFVALREHLPAAYWLAPLVYLAIHLSWGAGFWIGLIGLVLRHRLPSRALPQPLTVADAHSTHARTGAGGGSVSVGTTHLSSS